MYENAKGIKGIVSEGRHRDLVGGNWDLLGNLQFEFMIANGLLPCHRLLDIGCGCLRGGVRYAAYLEAGHYFGVEAHQALLDAGFEKELAKVGLQSKVPRANLLASDCFEFDHFEQSFDFAIVQSLFTHISMNSIRLCLTRLSQVMPRGGKFFATFF